MNIKIQCFYVKLFLHSRVKPQTYNAHIVTSTKNSKIINFSLPCNVRFHFSHASSNTPKSKHLQKKTHFNNSKLLSNFNCFSVTLNVDGETSRGDLRNSENIKKFDAGQCHCVYILSDFWMSEINSQLPFSNLKHSILLTFNFGICLSVCMNNVGIQNV